MQILELFCGIGGVAAALANTVNSIVAFDIDIRALETYRHNWRHDLRNCELASVTTIQLAELAAELWWMSPPCQPFTLQGKRSDDADSRTIAFMQLLASFRELRPRYFAMENVPPFHSSRTHAHLIETLNAESYQWCEQTLCASDFGLMTKRRRYYLVASRDHALSETVLSCEESIVRFGLDDVLDARSAGISFAADALLPRFMPHLHVIRQAAPEVARCFTSAYGKSPLRSGSYLQIDDASGRIRHFSPLEIARMLGFPATFQFPEQLTPRQCWDLVGNSLAVPVVRHVLSAIPELGLR